MNEAIAGIIASKLATQGMQAAQIAATRAAVARGLTVGLTKVAPRVALRAAGVAVGAAVSWPALLVGVGVSALVDYGLPLVSSYFHDGSIDWKMEANGSVTFEKDAGCLLTEESAGIIGLNKQLTETLVPYYPDAYLKFAGDERRIPVYNREFYMSERQADLLPDFLERPSFPELYSGSAAGTHPISNKDIWYKKYVFGHGSYTIYKLYHVPPGSSTITGIWNLCHVVADNTRTDIAYDISGFYNGNVPTKPPPAFKHGEV